MTSKHVYKLTLVVTTKAVDEQQARESVQQAVFAANIHFTHVRGDDDASPLFIDSLSVEDISPPSEPEAHDESD